MSGNRITVLKQLVNYKLTIRLLTKKTLVSNNNNT